MSIGILDTGGRWAVNGTPIYIPSNGITISHESIQSADTGRTEDGVMHIDWVRQNMVKIGLNYNYLTGREVAYLESLIQGKEYVLTYFDKGSVHSVHVYTSNISYKKETDALYTSDGGLYSNISASAIEI